MLSHELCLEGVVLAHDVLAVADGKVHGVMSEGPLRVIRDRVEPGASSAMSAVSPKAAVNSGH